MAELMPDPNIIGGSRVVWTAAIVLACIMLCGMVVLFSVLYE